MKTYSDSGLRVMMSYDATVKLLADSNYRTCRHIIHFNGEPCTNPGSINGAIHINKKVTLHRPNISLYIYYVACTESLIPLNVSH